MWERPHPYISFFVTPQWHTKNSWQRIWKFQNLFLLMNSQIVTITNPMPLCYILSGFSIGRGRFPLNIVQSLYIYDHVATNVIVCTMTKKSRKRTLCWMRCQQIFQDESDDGIGLLKCTQLAVVRRWNRVAFFRWCNRWSLEMDKYVYPTLF